MLNRGTVAVPNSNKPVLYYCNHVHSISLLMELRLPRCLFFKRNNFYSYEDKQAFYLWKGLSLWVWLMGHWTQLYKELRIKEALSVLVLCLSIFMFTSGSSVLLAQPCCGSLLWLSLLAIFIRLFWVYDTFFTTKRNNTWSPSFSCKMKIGCRLLLGTQSIHTERASWR